MKQMSIQEAREQFAEAVSTAQYGGETIEITRYGKPVARIVPISMCEVRPEDVFPELDKLTEREAHAVILNEETDPGETVLYRYDGVEVEYGYAKTRGRWLYTVSHPTSTYDSLGLREWTHRYEVCRDKRGAQDRYRDAIIDASKHWTEGTDSMWFDATGPTFDLLKDYSGIPLGSFGAKGVSSPPHPGELEP